jgi:hypothetical protein
MASDDAPPRSEPAPASATVRSRFRGGRFSFEALLIVLSVLLGFGVSEWRQASGDRELAERVLRNLHAELEHNRTELDQVLPRHREILDALVAADATDSTQSGWDVIFRVIQGVGGGMAPPALRRGAWDAAVSTGALRLLDYEVVAALSEIYERQSTSADFFGRAMGAYEPVLFEPHRQSETVQAFRWMAVELVSFESDLLELYDRQLGVVPARVGR